MTPCIAIIEPDSLAAAGLRGILEDMFVGVEFLSYPSVEAFIADSNRYFVHFFVRDSILFAHIDEFDMLKHRTFVLCTGPGASYAEAGFHVLDCTMTETDFIRRLLQYHQEGHPNGHPGAVRAPAGPPLTDREKEILVLLIQGKINKEIADRLDISVTTVIFHRNNICQKLGTRSLGRLTIYAVLAGLVDIDNI